MRRVRVCSGGCKRTSPSPGRGGVAIACRVLVSLGGSCACQAQQHLKLAASLPRTIRRSAAEEEKCRLSLAETCDTAHPKRQNAAERGRALYRGRTRAERFCNRCGFIKRAPRGRRNAALGGLVGSLRAPRSVAVRSLQLLALALSRFLGSSPCVRVASYLSAMATTAVPPSSRCLMQCS